MRKLQLLATTFGVVLLAAAPAAFAQQGGSLSRDGAGAGSGYGFAAPPGTPVTPHGQGGAGLVPPVEQQYSAARRAEAAGDTDVDRLLRQADAALARGDHGLANEYLERAETAVLNREAIRGGTDIAPARSELQRQIDQTRQALMARDRASAREHLRQAMAMAGRDAGTMTGAPGAATGMMPSQGGGAGPGSAGLGRGNAAAGTAYNPTAVPPYGGPTGTQTMPSPHMPGTSGSQAAGVPNVPPTGRGAPPAGQPFPQSGGTSSQLSTGGQIQPGSVTQGSDSGGGGSGAGGR